MESDIALGPEATLKLSMLGGKARIELAYAGVQATAGSFVELDEKAFLELLRAKLPANSIYSGVITAIEGAIALIP